MTKRAGPSQPSKSTTSTTGGDFKRRKAKVGKRAPKKLNATDTSFRTASIRTTAAAQALSLSNRINNSNINNTASSLLSELVVSCASELVSIKVGSKTLQQLTVQLGGHPAPSARKSAITGIRDIIASYNTQVNGEQTDTHGLVVGHIIKGILEVTVSTLARSACVDEDCDVRESSRMALKDLFVALTVPNDADIATTNDCASDIIIRPHVPLLTAYLLSALNSMDIDVRKDAVQVTDLYFGIFPLGFQYQAEGIIPAFIKILKGSNRSAYFSSNGKKKKKKSGNNTLQGGFRVAVLKALIQILQSASGSEHIKGGDRKFSNNRNNQLSEIRYTPGNLSTNTFIFLRKQEGNHSGQLLVDEFTTKIPSLESLFNQNQYEKQHGEKNCLLSTLSFASVRLNEGLSNEARLELLQKIRDYWVELMQSGTIHGSSLSIRLGNIEEATVLLTSLLRFWQCYCESIFSSKNDSILQNLNKTAEGILSLLLECFPIKDDSGNPANSHAYNSLNTLLSLVIAKVGSFLDDKAVWIDQISEYISVQMNLLTEDSRNFEKASSNALVILVDQLLHLSSYNHGSSELLLNTDDRLKLLSTLAFTFIQDSEDSIPCTDVTVTRSGRNAFELVAKLILEQGEKLDNKCDEFASQLLKIAYSFPSVLVSFRNTYLDETTTIFRSIMFILQRWDGNITKNDLENDGKVSHFARSMQKEISRFFEIAIGSKNTSLFECLPSKNQHQIICVLGMIRSPSQIALKLLSDTLNRNQVMKFVNISIETTSFVKETIFSIRKNLDLPDYLNFLLNSTGLNKLKKANQNASIDIFAFDPMVEQFCKYVINSGGYKFIPLLNPIISKWLLKENTDTEFSISNPCIIKTRAAIALLSACAKDLSLCKADLSLIFKSLPDLKNQTSESFWTNLCFNSDLFVWDKAKIQRYFSPFINLLNIMPLFLLNLLDSIKNICRDIWSDLDYERRTSQAKMLHYICFGFLYCIDQVSSDSILKSQELCSRLDDFSSELEDACVRHSSADISLAALGKTVKLKSLLAVGNKHSD